MSTREPQRESEGTDLPPELRYAEPSGPRPGGSALPLWVRVTALVLVVAVAGFYTLSYFV